MVMGHPQATHAAEAITGIAWIGAAFGWLVGWLTGVLTILVMVAALVYYYVSITDSSKYKRWIATRHRRKLRHERAVHLHKMRRAALKK